MTKATIIGNTTWGNTLAALLSNNGVAVKLWVRSESEIEELEQAERGYLLTSHIEDAMDGADLVAWVVPSQSLRQNVVCAKNYLTDSMLLVSAAKGLEVDSGERMSQVMAEEIDPSLRQQICALSGPNLAKEIAQGLPAASMIAAHDIAVAERARDLMSSAKFPLFATEDIIGVELCGSLKNIVALGAGMVDGLELGDNAKAAFITWCWAEITSLSVSLGAEAETFYGLAGLGDLIATCASTLSRNHYVGYEIAKGRPLEDIAASMMQVAEGVYAAKAVHRLSQEMNLKVPIVDLVYRVLFDNLPAAEAVANLSGFAANRHEPVTADTLE